MTSLKGSKNGVLWHGDLGRVADLYEQHRRTKGEGKSSSTSLSTARTHLFSSERAECGGGGGGGWGYAARLFLLFSFPCSADHERDWPPCKVVFFGLATNTLNVRNKNNTKVLDLGFFNSVQSFALQGLDGVEEPQVEDFRVRALGRLVDEPHPSPFVRMGCSYKSAILPRSPCVRYPMLLPFRGSGIMPRFCDVKLFRLGVLAAFSEVGNSEVG